MRKRRGPSRESVDRILEYLRTDASDEERAMWSKALDNVEPRGIGAWLRRRYGMLAQRSRSD